MFGRRKQQSFTELKETMRPTPDADGVTRVFSKELWGDPKIGNMLRELGYAPDDARNILPTAEDYIALFAAAKKRLHERVETFNREMTVRHGYCRAAPFLVIDHTIWDGEHGGFLYAQRSSSGTMNGTYSCWRRMYAPRTSVAWQAIPARCRRLRKS